MYIEVTILSSGSKLLLPTDGLGVTVCNNVTTIFVLNDNEVYWEVKESYKEVKQMFLNTVPTFATGVLHGN